MRRSLNKTAHTASCDSAHSEFCGRLLKLPTVNLISSAVVPSFVKPSVAPSIVHCICDTRKMSPNSEFVPRARPTMSSGVFRSSSSTTPWISVSAQAALNALAASIAIQGSRQLRVCMLCSPRSALEVYAERERIRLRRRQDVTGGAGGLLERPDQGIRVQAREICDGEQVRRLQLHCGCSEAERQRAFCDAVAHARRLQAEVIRVFDPALVPGIVLRAARNVLRSD